MAVTLNKKYVVAGVEQYRNTEKRPDNRGRQGKKG